MLLSFSVLAQVQPFNYGGEFTGTVTIKDSISVETTINIPDGVLDSHAASWGQVKDYVQATIVEYDLEDFTLPAMSAPPAQNSFSPITILSSVSIPANMIDWEITWTASGIHYKLSSIGDYNVELRESGGDIQISGQTRSQSAIAVDDTTNEPKIIFYVKPE